MSRRRILIQPVLLTLISVMFVGCGGSSDRLDLVSASGKVFLDDQPHGPAQVQFQPVPVDELDNRPQLGGEVGSDGTFTLTTYEPGDGAPPGEYTVTLEKAGSGDDNAANPDAMMQMMSGGGGPATKPLTVTIPAEGSANLELKFVSTDQKTAPTTGPNPVPPSKQ